MTAYLVLAGTYSEVTAAARHATFNVVSIATTTGYASTDYAKWPLVAPLWMLLLCVFASCAGSTGGGIKMIRAQLMWLNTGRILTALVHPHAYLAVKVRKVVIPNEVIFGTLVFTLMFGATTVFVVLFLLLTGLDFLSASTAAIACITNTGPGLGVVRPAENYASLSDAQKWVCTAAMLLGRLELFALLVVFTPAFWKR